MKAILLARVSSEEQELGNSIPAQVHKMQEYAEHKGLQILEVQEITESSSIDTRKKFDLIIKTIQASKEPIALVQRSFKESIILGDLLKAGKLQIHTSSVKT
jgi:DNA invertase Pin-like site-specific DNA recombinase